MSRLVHDSRFLGVYGTYALCARHSGPRGDLQRVGIVRLRASRARKSKRGRTKDEYEKTKTIVFV